MVISQLGSQFGLDNNISTKGLSADDCDGNESDELGEGNDNNNTNESVDIKG